LGFSIFIFVSGQRLSCFRGHDPEGAEADGFVDQESGDGHQERGQVAHRARRQVLPIKMIFKFKYFFKQ
jgi:hypothetical protein